MNDTGCSLLALLTFMLGAGVGGGLVYVRSVIQMAKLRRRIEKLQLTADSTPQQQKS